MLNRSPGRVAVALLLALFAALPTVAWAGEEEEGASTLFSLKASHGYRMVVIGAAELDDGRGVVGVYLTKGRTTAVYYLTKGTVTDTSLKADFGALGRIDLVLRRSGKEGTVRARPPCNGESSRYEKTTYQGTFEFRGEEGFTRASASRGQVSPKGWIDLLCRNSFEIEKDYLEPFTTGASLKTNLPLLSRAKVEFELTKSRPDGRTVATAFATEQKQGITIGRGVQILTGPSTFRYSSTLSTASVDLPAPFSGSAVYRRDAKPANRWRGNLSVDFPGRANVPLVRPGLRPTLFPATWSVEPPDFR